MLTVLGLIATVYLAPDKDPLDLRRKNAVIKVLAMAAFFLLGGSIGLGIRGGSAPIEGSDVKAERQHLPLPMYEIKHYDDIRWQELIQNAKVNLYAEGIVLDAVDPRVVVDKVKGGLTAVVVLVAPNSGVLLQRDRDEHMNFRNPNKIVQKLQAFREYSRTSLGQNDKRRLTVKLTSRYPTMAILIIDNDLYAYAYTLGKPGTTSSVVVFKDYMKNDLANSFKDHFDSIERDARLLKL